MFAKGQTVVQWLEQFAPKHIAMPDDKIGLQLGTLQKEIKKILVTLDVTDDVVEEAIRMQADLIIAHHAIIYKPLPHIQTDSPAGRLIEKLIKHDIAVYVAHTNLDIAEGGMNDLMARALNLSELSSLEEVHTEKLSKLVVFVPESHADRVREAVFNAGAGWIGQYSHCSFNLEGTGTFMPREGSDPYIGKLGRLESVREIRVETILPDSVRKKVIQAMLKAHPYEEVAYDLYPVDLKGRVFGLGRVGKLSETVSLQQLADMVKQALEVPALRVVGEPDKPVRKVAVLGGSGSRYFRHALFAGADVLVTGDIDYHSAHDALAAGLALIDPGHNAEKIVKAPVAEYLNVKFKENKLQTTAIASSVNTEPFRFV
ncbi:Nif3-like dinuclear metal center hexameric protein [Ferviditalea candida]|uniref:GTP cyclohydrolase 1 type 2 homolog n=1 Tax=Ferviditalea candida TaxID=3108399 RepID=A0ABU5ZDT4_9BACL|nr:Nif3-like dinuclear metal center hexameric protein [Paenibacillaceae bacterium T2]